MLTNVLRGEWGFHGIVVSDYTTANEGYMYPDMGLQAGTNLWLNTDAEKFVNKGYNSATMANILRKRAHEILYTVVNSSAMNGIDENVKVVKVLPLWQKWLIAADICAGVLILLAFSSSFAAAKRTGRNAHHYESRTILSPSTGALA